MRANKVVSVLALLGFLAVAVSKIVSGETPNLTELGLAFTAALAAFGFQR